MPKYMKRFLIFLIIASFVMSATVDAQQTKDYAIQITATTQASPASIKLKWRKVFSDTARFLIYKKAKTALSWPTMPITTITSGDTTYTDNAVIVDSVYEYQIKTNGVSYTPAPTGYILAGIKAPAVHNRGGLVMLVDNTFSTSCAAELATYMEDLRGDGWQVIRHDLARTLPDTIIKQTINADYFGIPNVKAVMILGHLAVPYSGQIAPDGHTDHRGAWPCDAYYGTINTLWTDSLVVDTSAAYAANHNRKFDGKWDPIIVPTLLRLQIGRVDFFNMPAFSATEDQLMRNYLRKAHTYKMDSLNMVKRALINDNFGAMAGEAFAANGWRNFSPLVGTDSVSAKPFISTLASSSYQWAYGCGGGSFTSASGVGSTTDFVANPVNGIFTLLFGSYFGDWNTQNNFLRAPLCADTPSLMSCWAGRPNWFFHHMALGEHLGYSSMLSQNNDGLYTPTNFGARWVHVALMGDLSLRTDYIKRASNINVVSADSTGATITWTASPDTAVLGYYVYRADSMWGHYNRISPLVTTTTYADTVGVSGKKYYMARPVKLQSTPSGDYYNLGLGVVDSATVYYPASVAYGSVKVSKLSLYPNPAADRMTLEVVAQESGTGLMYIVNSSGQNMYPVSKELKTGLNTFYLDVSSLPAGIYTVCVRTESGVVAEKFVKL